MRPISEGVKKRGRGGGRRGGARGGKKEEAPVPEIHASVPSFCAVLVAINPPPIPLLYQVKVFASNSCFLHQPFPTAPCPLLVCSHLSYLHLATTRKKAGPFQNYHFQVVGRTKVKELRVQGCKLCCLLPTLASTDANFFDSFRKALSVTLVSGLFFQQAELMVPQRHVPFFETLCPSRGTLAEYWLFTCHYPRHVP